MAIPPAAPIEQAVRVGGGIRGGSHRFAEPDVPIPPGADVPPADREPSPTEALRNQRRPPAEEQ